jgi:hypothetical protein
MLKYYQTRIVEVVNEARFCSIQRQTLGKTGSPDTRLYTNFFRIKGVKAN